MRYQRVRTSLFEPVQSGWVNIRDIASPLFLCKNMDGMCLCERPGWPGFRDLGFWDGDVGDLDEKTPACCLGGNFLTDFLSSQNIAPKMAWFWSFMFFHISTMRISFICESARVHDAIRVTHHLSLCSTILVLLFEFVPVGRAEILYMNTPQYSSR